MAEPETDNETCSGIGNPEVYKIYTRWQIIESSLSTLFCIGFVAGITAVTILTGWKWMAGLYILPAVCYIAVAES